MSDTTDILGGKPWLVEQGDCLQLMRQMPDGCVDLVFFSPPYTGARLYLENGADLGIARDVEAWVAWMVEVFRECRRVCTGLVACVCDDQTSDYRYGCAPYLLMADLCRAGFNLRRPCVYRRSGIPGSGGPDWFRCDHEPIICVTPPGRLPWSDVTACGHPPKWAPGGEMSHRLSDGTRRNQWGRNDTSDNGRKRDGSHGKGNNPGVVKVGKSHTKAKPNGTDEQQSYTVPVLANPGTVVQRLYTAQEVAELLGGSDVVDCTVGGGQMGEGDRYARSNEAPFPEELVERFVLSFCQPGGIVFDPFSGSGTTLAVAVRHNRRALACDLRESQVQLTKRRLNAEVPLALFAEDA